MQKRIWIWLLVTALVAAALHFATRPGPVTAVSTPNPVAPAPALPAATAALVPAPPVEIQDRKTIDFSSGKPVVRDTAADKAAVDAAVKEMQAATKDVTFGPETTPAK